jgi:hypothetical protein
MAAGNTTTGSLADSLPIILDSARIVREYPGVMAKSVDRVKLSEGTGTAWDEISLAAIEAQVVTENTILDNPQQLADTLLSITPTMTGITTVITDRTMARISKNVAGQIGKLAQNAIERKKDEDGLATLDGATTSLCGTGTTLTSGHIAAAANRITGNVTEPATGPIMTVLHPYQVKDLQDEVVAGVGTYVVPAGLTEEYFRNGFSGSLYNTNVMLDGNITIDATPDAKGGVFAREAIILVQGRDLKTETKRLPEVGGGADQLFIYDEYAYGERSAGNWLFEIMSDATVPTS